MVPLQAIAYCSRIVPGITVQQIEELVREAAVHNLIGGVTGVLLAMERTSSNSSKGLRTGCSSAIHEFSMRLAT